jgi:hypothetical protein
LAADRPHRIFSIAAVESNRAKHRLGRVLAPPIGAGRLHRVVVDEPLEAGLRKPKKPLSGDRQRK